MPTKSCKSCFTQIDARASKCPNCRADQSPDYGCVLQLIGVIAAGLLLGQCFSSMGDSEPASDRIDADKIVTAQVRMEKAKRCSKNLIKWREEKLIFGAPIRNEQQPRSWSIRVDPKRWAVLNDIQRTGIAENIICMATGEEPMQNDIFNALDKNDDGLVDRIKFS